MNLDPLAAREQQERLDLARAIGAVVIAFLLAQLAGQMVSQVLSASSALGGARSAGGPTLLPAVVVPAMLASELALLLVALIVPMLSALPLRSALGLHAAPFHVMLAAAFGTVMLGPIGDVLMTLLSRLAPGATLGVVPVLRDVAQRAPLALTWPAFALLPGIAEELLFRGVLQRSISRPRAAMLASGIAFAAFHVDPVHVAGVLPLGLFLSWVGQRAGTTTTIFAHVVNNTVALLTIKTTTLDVGYGTPRETPIAWVVASLLGAVLAIRIISRATPRGEP